MASSLIRINEATVEELQQLRGVGPKRADYIAAFRNEVGPISNAFDLATATGISVRAAEQMSAQIDWERSIHASRIHFWPLVFTCLASAWLMLNAFTTISFQSTAISEQLFNFSLILILAGSIILTADIAAASALNLDTETTRFFPISAISFAAGLTLMVLLGISSYFLDLSTELTNSLHQALLFVFLALLMTWLIYGPSLLLRLLITSGPELERARLLYDLSIIPIALFCGIMLVFINSDSLLEEIFTAWVLVIVLSNALELFAGRAAFTAMLSDLDRSRFRFLLRHQNTAFYDQFPKRSIGMASLASGLMIFAVLALGVY